MLSGTLASPVTDEAVAAVWNADNDRALALLHNVDAPGCAAMRARIWFRVKRYDRVTGEHDRRDAMAYCAQEASALACAAAYAHAAVGDERRAQRALGGARDASARSRDPLLRIEHAYASARVDFVTGNFDRSSHTLADATELAQACGRVEARAPYQLELNHLRARMHELEGRHRGLAGDYAGEEECYVTALLAVELVERRDRWFEANLLAKLADALATYPAHRSRQYVLSRSIPFAWNAHLDHAASLVKRGLRNNQRLFGFDEHVETFGGRTAPSLGARLGERVDALLLDEWQSSSKFFGELRFAISIALDIDWISATHSDAVHLARLAMLVAPYEPELAKKLAGRYASRLGEFVCPGTVPEPRRETFETFLEGCLAKAFGNGASAAERLQHARDSWLARKCGWMAAIAGIERHALSGDENDLACAADFLQAYPKTTFARRLSCALERAQRSQGRGFAYLGLYGAA